MNTCQVCGTEVDEVCQFVCGYCGESHCADHRLPETHDCPALDDADVKLGPNFAVNNAPEQDESAHSKNREDNSDNDDDSDNSDETTVVLGEELPTEFDDPPTATCNSCGREWETEDDPTYCPICRSEGIKPDYPSSPDPAKMQPRNQDENNEDKGNSSDKGGLIAKILGLFRP